MRTSNASREMVLHPDPKASLPGICFLGTFMGVWSGGFFGGFAFFGAAALGVGELAVPAAVVIGIVGFVGTIALSYYRVESTRYTVSADAIERESGVFSTSISRVSFDDVTDVHYKQSFLDARFGVGTVKLNTAGSDAEAITVGHVEDARRLYDELEERIDG